MTINEQAPVKSTREIAIAATPELVWAILTDLDRWPTWNPAVTQMNLTGPLAAGSVFRWRSGLSIVSTLVEVDPPRRIVWTGQTFGTRAIHLWVLEPTTTGTLVRTAESFDGWLPRLLPSMLQRTLDKALEDGLAALKAAAERTDG